MTTIASQTVECCVCGQESEQVLITSTNSFGKPDLDLRPPEMERSTMHAWVQICPHCGYANSDLSESVNAKPEYLSSPEYRSIGNGFPALAGSFLKSAALLTCAEDYERAMWQYLYAAWDCDDAKRTEQSILCRQQALNILCNQTLNMSPKNLTFLVVDLNRRCFDFAGAASKLREMPVSKGHIIQAIRDYQDYLIQNQDAGIHTVQEAVVYSRSKPPRC